jgi:Putative peptidoglycan binding domain
MRIRPLLLAAMLALLVVPAAHAADAARPFSGHGMWIWQIASAAGGDPAAIAQQARAAGIDTLVIKAADGPATWSQFSPTLVHALQADGLTVCAYQRLRGTRPVAEAAAAGRAVRAGADCFVIDAESELNGRYAQARQYVHSLRARIGADFAVAFTSFPYLDAHPLLPVSAFLGPGGATVSMPQIYWKDIGDSPAAAWTRTVATNRVYGAPLAPVGQLYSAPRRADVTSFRRLARAYDADGVSWWSWDSAAPAAWSAITAAVSAPALPALPASVPAYPTVRPGARSDVVVWAKDHLRAQGYAVTADTRFDATTAAAVRAFQADAGLPATGTLDAATWAALLDV